MPEDKVDIEFGATFTGGDKLRESLRGVQTEQKKLIEQAQELNRILEDNAKVVARAFGLPEPTNPQSAARVIRRSVANLTPNARDRAASFSAIHGQLDPAAPEPIRSGVASLAGLEANAKAQREGWQQDRDIREQQRAYNNTNEGTYDNFIKGHERSMDKNEVQRQAYRDTLATPRGQEDEANRRKDSAYNSERRRRMIRLATPEARAQLDAEGIKLPSDMNPFAKALQNTFKSAASLGMLEAMSGGSAAPLVRAFASNIIAGAILPSAMQALGSAGSAFGKVAGKVASGAGSAISGAIGTGASSVLGGIGEAGAGVLGGAATVAMPVLAVGALAGILAGGAAAYISSIQTHQSTLGEQGAAAIGGPGWAGNNSLFNTAALGSSTAYQFSQDQMAGVGVGLGNLGVQGGQPLRSNMDNAALLARYTGTGDPSAFTGLVGSLATAGGMSADDITKMIGLLAKQNELTAGNRVPLDTMVGNLQTLVSATGGLPVTASSVAGLTAITNKFNNMGKAGQSLAQNVGNMMAPLMGATGVSSMMAENLLGMTPDAFHQAQTSNPTLLFNKASTFLQNSTAGMSGYAKQQQAQMLISSLPQIFGSNLSSSNIETLAQAMLGNNGSKQGSLTASAEKILGMTPTDANAVKRGGQKLAQVQTDDVSKGILALENKVYGVNVQQETSLQTIIGLLGRSTGQWQGSGNPAILAYETAHGGPPTLVNGVQTNPDGSPYKGPRLGGGGALDPNASAGTVTTALGVLGADPSIFSMAAIPTYPTALKNITIPKINADGTTEHVGMSPAMYSAARAASMATGVPLEILMAQWAREGAKQPGQDGGIGQFGTGATQWVDKNVKGLGNWNPATETAATGFLAMASYDKYDTGLHGGNLAAGLAAYNGSGPAAQNYSQSVIQASQGITATPITIVIVDKTKNGVKAHGSHS